LKRWYEYLFHILCNYSVVLVQPQAGATVSGLPVWAEWGYDTPHLPQAFHQDVGLTDVLKIMRRKPKVLYSYESLEIIALICALAGRDIHTAHFTESDELPNHLPAWMSDSKYNIGDLEHLENAVESLTNHIKIQYG